MLLTFLFYTWIISGTRTDDLSSAEHGAAYHGTGSDSVTSSDRLMGYEGDETQHIVGEPADEGLIAGVSDDILYPEVSSFKRFRYLRCVEASFFAVRTQWMQDGCMFFT